VGILYAEIELLKKSLRRLKIIMILNAVVLVLQVINLIVHLQCQCR